MAKRYHDAKKMKHGGMVKGGRSINYSGDLTERYGEAGHEMENMHKRFENQDFGMIHEDHRAIANLPQDVRYHEWPKAGGYTPEGLDDTIRGINRQLDDDSDRMHSGLKPRKA